MISVHVRVHGTDCTVLYHWTIGMVVLFCWTPQTRLIAQESALSSLHLERDEMAEEKAVLLDKCSASESQLQDAKVHVHTHILCSIKELCSICGIASLHRCS